MTNAEKRDRIRQSLAEHPGESNRWHGKRLGVADKTVGSVRVEIQAELTRLDLHGAQAQDQREEEELVRERGDGRLLAAVNLIVSRGNAELFFVAGQEVPGEVAHLPRRPAG
jgi:hypothetical protein